MTTVLRGLIVRSIGLSAGLGLIILLIAAMLSMGCSRPARSATKAGVTPPGTGSGSTPRTLRVCADPNNLPFSNNRLEGFENRLADLLATELHATVDAVRSSAPEPIPFREVVAGMRATFAIRASLASGEPVAVT